MRGVKQSRTTAVVKDLTKKKTSTKFIFLNEEMWEFIAKNLIFIKSGKLYLSITSVRDLLISLFIIAFYKPICDG